MGLFEFERYYVAHAALMFLTFVPCLIVFFCSLCLARRRMDPARTAFTYLKAALACLSISIFLDTCAYGLTLARSRLLYGDDYYYAGSDVIRAIALAQSSTFAVAQLFEAFTDIFVFLTLLRLTTGILIVQSGNPVTRDKILKFASYGIAALLAILAIAKFGLRLHFATVLADGDEDLSYSEIDKLEKQFNSSRQIDFSFRVLVLVLAVAIVARSIMVKIQTQTDPRLTLASNISIACAGLWLLRTVYEVASMASTVDLKDSRDDPEYKNYFYVIDVIFGVWPQFILLCLVFFLGHKKRNGLWSSEQPFMMVNPGAQQTSWGPGHNGYNVAQNVAPPMVQQQPPQQQGWVQNAPPQQQQSTYYVPPKQYAVSPQQDTYPQYPPQQQQQQQNLQSPISQTRSPPPHEETMGLNHQADGTPPQTTPQTYYEKA